MPTCISVTKEYLHSKVKADCVRLGVSIQMRDCTFTAKRTKHMNWENTVHSTTFAAVAQRSSVVSEV
jgi:hypothetical protein